jgi:hypothetical protein
MPTLGRPSRGRGRWLLILFAVLVAAFVVWRWRRHAAPSAAPPPPARDAATVATGVDAGPAPAVDAAEPAPAKPPASEVLEKSGLRFAHVVIDGPLETALVREAGREVALPLSQVVVRALVWWVAIPNDLRRGDEVDLLYELRSGEEPAVSALRFKSGKLNRTFAAYRYHGRLYLADGNELELRLTNGPVDEYEQVTSLLNDGRGHKGVDFKTPVGTPVKAPFDGTVARRNWKTRDNGQSLELVESAGRRRSAIFLHLSRLADGNSFARGEVVAWSGNTGHSFAPHLHYQLMSSSGQVLDPFSVHATTRRALPPSEMAPFSQEVHHLDELMELVRR